MKTILEKLETVMKSELDIHITLVTSAHEFNGALKGDDLAGVDRQRQVYDESVCRIEKCEAQRTECCIAIAKSLGVVRRPLKMGMLLEKLPPMWRDRLGGLQRALHEKLTELFKVNVANRILLEEGIRMADHTIAMVRKAGKKYGAYGHYGQMVASPVTMTIINRTV